MINIVDDKHYVYDKLSGNRCNKLDKKLSNVTAVGSGANNILRKLITATLSFLV